MESVRGRTTGLALAALGLAAGLAALGIGDGWDAASWGPRTVPLLAAAALVVAGLADAMSAGGTAPGPASGAAVEGASAAVEGGDRRLAWALFAVAVLYALLMARTGYLVSTAVAAPAAFVLFGMRRPATLALAAIACPLALHLVFFAFLGTFPPRGAWFDALDWLPL